MEFYDAIATLTGAPSWALSLSHLFSSVFEICVGRLQRQSGNAIALHTEAASGRFS
jgi:hypothetical protein